MAAQLIAIRVEREPVSGVLISETGHIRCQCGYLYEAKAVYVDGRGIFVDSGHDFCPECDRPTELRHGN